MTSTSHRTENKNLTQSERYELVRQIATHTHESEIAQWLESVGKPSNDVQQLLSSYRRNERYRPLIEKIRAQYEAGVADIAVASKRYRLQQYQILYDRLKTEGKLELAAKMLERSQGELEGKAADGRPNIFITQFNQLSETEMEEKKLAVMQRIQRLKNEQRLQLERGGYEELRPEEKKQTETEIIAEVIEETDEQST